MKKATEQQKKEMAARIRALRGRRTIEQAAQAWGQAYQSVYVYESGRSMPSLASAILIADAEGVSLDWLAGRSECRDIRSIVGKPDNDRMRD